jgi:hypothetical protein
LKLLVILFFHIFNFFLKILMGGKHFSKLRKSSHYFTLLNKILTVF